MPVGKLLSSLLIVSIVGSAVSPRPQSSLHGKRVINKKYKFSISRPEGWYVFLDAEVPGFYNFPADKMLPQGEFPPGGAAIQMYADRIDPAFEAGGIAHWAGSIAEKVHGANVKEESIEAPGEKGLQVTFERLPLGKPMVTKHFELLVWQTQGTMYGALLEYAKDDPRAEKYKEALFELMRSFRPR